MYLARLSNWFRANCFVKESVDGTLGRIECEGCKTIQPITSPFSVVAKSAQNFLDDSLSAFLCETETFTLLCFRDCSFSVALQPCTTHSAAFKVQSVARNAMQIWGRAENSLRLVIDEFRKNVRTQIKDIYGQDQIFVVVVIPSWNFTCVKPIERVFCSEICSGIWNMFNRIRKSVRFDKDAPTESTNITHEFPFQSGPLFINRWLREQKLKWKTDLLSFFLQNCLRLFQFSNSCEILKLKV